MSDSAHGKPVEIRIFGFLRKHMDRQGLPYLIKKKIGHDDLTPVDIAEEISLPLSEIEAVFVNGKISDMQTVLSPGDRIAFLPYGTPGPYRVFLGIINRGKGGGERE